MPLSLPLRRDGGLWRGTSFPAFILLSSFAFGMVGVYAFPKFLLPFTPFHLCLCLAFVLLGYPRNTARLWWYVFVVFVAGYSVEVAGVQTGLIFGEYQYLHTLGIKLWGVPPMIGINWVLVTLCGANIGFRLRLPTVLQIVASVALLLFLDVLMERVSARYGFWSWTLGEAPLQNFVAWAVCAALFVGLYKKMGLAANFSRWAVFVYTLQVVFFLWLNILA